MGLCCGKLCENWLNDHDSFVDNEIEVTNSATSRNETITHVPNVNRNKFLKPVENRELGIFRIECKITQGATSCEHQQDIDDEPKIETINNKELIKQLLTNFIGCPPPEADKQKPFKILPIYNLTELHFIYEKLARNKKFINHYKINKICYNWNPFLYLHYSLRKALSASNSTEKYLFHGTKKKYLTSILLENFNWRKSSNGKLGRGVYFANNPWFSSHYCDSDSEEMIIIMAKVLISKWHVGNPETVLPDEGYDATVSSDNQVFVKYDDSSFYPVYIIYFSKR